jgi:hypothetical protein
MFYCILYCIVYIIVTIIINSNELGLVYQSIKVSQIVFVYLYFVYNSACPLLDLSQ